MKIFLFISCVMLSWAAAAQVDTPAHSPVDTQRMQEVIVSHKTAFTIHEDTISYRTDSLTNDRLAAVEQVISRLPGIEVSGGKIMAQGKPVKKLLIDGKEYMANNIYSVLLTMPAEIVEKIQVADWYDDDAAATGVKGGSESKFINLKLKDDFNRSLYSTANAGYATANKYGASAFLNYMDKKSLRATLSVNTDNLGAGDAAMSGNINSVQPTNGTQKQAQNGNYNFSYDNGGKLQWSGVYTVDNTVEQQLYRTQRTTYLQNNRLVQQRTSGSLQSALQQALVLRGKYLLNKNTTLRIDLNLKRNTENADKTNNDTTANNDVVTAMRTVHSSEESENTSAGVAAQLVKKFDMKGRTLALNARVDKDATQTNGDAQFATVYAGAIGTSSNNFTEHNKHNSVSASMVYTEPVGEKGLVYMQYAYTQSRYTQDLQLNRRNGDDVLYDNSNVSVDNNNAVHNVSLAYQYRSGKLTVKPQIGVAKYQSQAIAVQQPVKYIPALNAMYHISRRSQLNFTYNGNVNMPSAQQLQPVLNPADSMNIYQNNPGLKPEMYNSVSLGYNMFKAGTGQAVRWAVSADKTNNKIVNSMQITQAGRVERPENVDGNYALHAVASVTQPIVKKKLVLTVSLPANSTNNVYLVNGSLQTARSNNLAPDMRLVMNIGKWYEGSVSGSYKWYKQTGIAANNMVRQELIYKHTIMLNSGWRWGTYVNYTANSIAGKAQQATCINMLGDKTFDKPAGLTLRVQANNLFNNKPGVQRIVADNYIEETYSNNTGRSIMFSIMYRISARR